LGRSRGGLTTKIHMLCDALGMPIKFIVTAGQESDMLQAIPLLTNQSASYVIADKGYDSDAIISHIKCMDAEPVIPPKSNRIVQRFYDKYLYKDRNLIERFFNKLKQFRKIATRFEKSKTNFDGLLYLACSFLWLI
jgi:transposase